jgi:hypothetical protein
MTSIQWCKSPDDFSLSARDGWSHLGANRYRAVRNHFLILQRKSTHSKTGPIIFERKLPSGAEIRHERKRSVVTKQNHLITSHIQKTVATKLLSEVGAQATAEISFLPPVAKVQATSLSKISSEFFESLVAGLSETHSYEVVSTDEVMSSFSLRVPDGEPNKKNTYYFYLPVWLWQWDIYLFRQEVLEFTYRRSKLLWRRREDIRYFCNDTKLPIAQVQFYEPENGLSVDSARFEPEVPDAHVISILPLANPCATTIKLGSPTLESFLPIAFPTSKKEKTLRERTQSISRSSKIFGGLLSEEWVALPDRASSGRRRMQNQEGRTKRKNGKSKVTGGNGRVPRKNHEPKNGRQKRPKKARPDVNPFPKKR